MCVVCLSFISEFRDTWSFLDCRIKDAFDLQKSVQEVNVMTRLLYAYVVGIVCRD